jgi:hypothetical protein
MGWRMMSVDWSGVGAALVRAMRKAGRMVRKARCILTFSLVLVMELVEEDLCSARMVLFCCWSSLTFILTQNPGKHLCSTEYRYCRDVELISTISEPSHSILRDHGH